MLRVDPRWIWLLLAAALSVLGCSSTPEVDERTELTQGWQYRIGDSPRDARGRFVWSGDAAESAAWTDLEFPGKPPGRHQWVWLRVPLPEGSWQNPTLALDPVMSEYEVYLDGRLLHRFGDPSSSRYRTSGVAWQLIPLPADASGKYLYLRVRSAWISIGVHGRAFVGARGAHLERVVAADFGAFGVAFVGWLLALLAAALSGFGVEQRLLRSFALYGFCSTSYALFYTRLKDVILPAPGFWFWLWYVAGPVSMIAVLVFVETAFGAGPRKLIRRLWQIHLIWTVAVSSLLLALELGGLLLAWGGLATGLLASLRLLITVDVIAILAVVFRASKRGDGDALVFLAGCVPAVAVTLRDVLIYFGLIEADWQSYVHWGFLGLLIALVVVVQRRYSRRLQAYAVAVSRNAEEKALLLRDLHDGIGGITTNISLLAEVAKQAGSAPAAAHAVTNISELSREGISEIRMFLQSLDDTELDWNRLVKDLRHLGRQTLEPHRISFELEARIDETAPPPTSLLFLNVQKIVREALTNVVKHSRARHAHICVEIAPGSVVLTVRDDGVGGRERRDGGRGISNMNARARHLGGELRVTSDAGTLLTLCIPIPNRTPPGGLPSPQPGD